MTSPALQTRHVSVEVFRAKLTSNRFWYFLWIVSFPISSIFPLQVSRWKETIA
ncbi:hypothetical protein BDW71DRAFT_155240 [Aspergillus fruticulosus]